MHVVEFTPIKNSPPAAASSSSSAASQMAALPEEITHLFTKLASHLRPPPPAASGVGSATISAGEPSAYISSLSASLNSGGASETRVLDAALSLMCFKTLEVDRARIECLVRTIVSVLSSSISCRVLRSDGGDEEMLSVGSSVSPGDCGELIRSCAAILDKLGDHDVVASHSYALWYAVVKAAVLSPRYQCLFPLPYYIGDGENSYEMGTITPELTCCIPDEICPSDHSIPLRVLLWHLDPSILKHDLSAMIQEVIRRPLLSLRKELYDQMAWRLIIVCLVCSPVMFMETRALLHSWFLVTGLSSVLELHTGVVSSVLDVLFRPMLWGISMELGQKFPFSYAYFPSKHSDLLAILTGPISCRRFLDLVSYINATVDSDKRLTQEIISHSSRKTFRSEASKGIIGYNSAWSMTINFPVWFNFATALIFYREDSQDYLSQIVSKEIIAESTNDVNVAEAGAFYLSWMLCPTNEEQHRMLANIILELSRSWIRNNKKYSTDEYHSRTVHHGKKLRIPIVENSEKIRMSNNCLPVSAWLKEFDDLCAKFCGRMTTSHARAEGVSEFPSLQHNLLPLEIPLGILVVSPTCVNEQGCEMLLHYASTGQVLESNEVQRKPTDYVNSDAVLASCGGDPQRWALNGACLLFGWLDIVEDMSVMVCECEDTCRNFISELKSKTSQYLLSCVNLLLELQNEAAVARDAVIDLRNRLLKWKQKGETFDGCQAFEDVIIHINRKFQLS